MAQLTNNFSWSFSAADDFDTCRRKRYWAKYAMWGGWDAKATELQRKAYRFTKMSNRYSLQGNAVEMSVMWALRQKQQGKTVTVDEAYDTVAKPFLNKAWKESRDKMWETNPKKYCSLHEHYYPQLSKGTDKEWTQGVIEKTKTCIDNFLQRVLPRLTHVKPADEVTIASPDSGGQPEHFTFEGVTVYAIPDYVYREGDTWHIIDWKSGKSKPEHQNQLALYGLWAHLKHGVPAENILVYLEYLAEGKTAVEQLTDGHLEKIQEHMRMSIHEMSDYLVDADRKVNAPLPQEEWELVLSRGPCRVCSFYELCEPELKNL